MRTCSVTAEYQPLSAVSLIGSVTISALPSNTGDVFFRGDDGSDVWWPRGCWFCFHSVDLSNIFVKGTPGDAVSVIGGTWS
ncbi:MAG: hypothetical protein FWE88_09785 [Phycisphaerae bacterium]|nr:hypothetical protein [Phycisphaerae bacterium]